MSICKQTVKKFCKEFENIENYQEAVNSPEQWDCHHRLEETGLSRKDLIDKGMYYDRPADELIFLTHRDHTSLHSKGKFVSNETKKKMSDAQKGKIYSEETKKKISDAQKGENNHMWGKHHSIESRKKMSDVVKNSCRRGDKHPCYKFICPIKLTYMYCKQGKSIKQIAKELGYGIRTIDRHLKELNIKKENL